MDIVELQRWSFIPDLPPDIGGIRKLLEDYSKIPPSQVDEHLIEIVGQISSFPHDHC